MAKKDTETKLESTICDIKGINSINIESLIRIIRGEQVMLDLIPIWRCCMALKQGLLTKLLNVISNGSQRISCFN